jgi:hypothetical protein
VSAESKPYTKSNGIALPPLPEPLPSKERRRMFESYVCYGKEECKKLNVVELIFDKTSYKICYDEKCKQLELPDVLSPKPCNVVKCKEQDITELKPFKLCYKLQDCKDILITDDLPLKYCIGMYCAEIPITDLIPSGQCYKRDCKKPIIPVTQKTATEVYNRNNNFESKPKHETSILGKIFHALGKIGGIGGKGKKGRRKG